MTINFDERPVSRSATYTDPTEDREYVCTGTNDSIAVTLLALQLTPSAITSAAGILKRQDVKLSHQGHNLYYVTVPYAKKKLESGSWTWDFDTSGGTFNIKASKQTMGQYVPPGGVIVNHQGAIGKQIDGTVDGVDAIIPSLKINATYKHPLGVVTLAFASAMADLTGTFNSAPFLNRQPGEVLFLGARGSDGTESEASVGYSFAVEKNLQNKVIGGITVAEKLGHDYVWVEFQNAVDAGQPITKPKQINIERLYDPQDLKSLLGFG